MVKEFDLKELFSDYETVGVAAGSSIIYRLRYGRDGEGLELGLFHSEDKGDAEYHLNVYEIDKQNDVHDCISFNATALKPRVTQFGIDVIDKDVDTEKIERILKENGIEVVGINNDYGWEYDEYFK